MLIPTDVDVEVCNHVCSFRLCDICTQMECNRPAGHSFNYILCLKYTCLDGGVESLHVLLLLVRSLLVARLGHQLKVNGVHSRESVCNVVLQVNSLRLAS